MKLLIASKNLHKVREFRSLLKEFDLYSLADFPSFTPPEESGKTFEENAILKAKHAARSLGLLTLADDSGLVVPALNGAPGIYSARFAGEHPTEKENREKLLKDMAHLDDLDRNAYFECAIAISSPEKLLTCVSGRVEGTILKEERGKKGFGYDSLFLKYDYSLTFGEIDEAIKNRISHRGKALKKALLFLESYLSVGGSNSR